MKTLMRATLAIAVVATLATPSTAAVITPHEIAFNVNGAVHSTLVDGDLPGTLPGTWNFAAFDVDTGLGTIALTLTGAGTHSVIGFFDYEIDEALNTFFNEYGLAVGTPSAGLSWQIDEPGYVFGDIYDNLLAGDLDNTNALLPGDEDDVSVALGWNVALTAGQTALVRFTISLSDPGEGFYLAQYDPDSQAAVYYQTRLDIRGESIPEPFLVTLLGLGLLAVGRRVRRS